MKRKLFVGSVAASAAIALLVMLAMVRERTPRLPAALAALEGKVESRQVTFHPGPTGALQQQTVWIFRDTTQSDVMKLLTKNKRSSSTATSPGSMSLWDLGGRAAVITSGSVDWLDVAFGYVRNEGSLPKTKRLQDTYVFKTWQGIGKAEAKP
jgi:hypothetical protein